MHNGKGKLLSAIVVTLGLLLTAGQAQAQQQQPKCGDASINHDGNVDLIPEPGQIDCVIAGDITVTNGYLRIQTPTGGKIQVGGNISTTSNANSSGNVILTASRTIEIGGSITVNNAAAPSGMSGSVDIKANNIQAGAPFVIGSATSNGVAGTINVDTVNGGGNEQFFFRGGVRVRNRGDITLTSPTSISANASASKAGTIILESVDATINLPAGTVGVDGAPGKSAGALVLMAHAINAADGAILSASDDGVAKLSHFVNISAGTISYQGATGLTIRANGGGTGPTGSFVYVLPEFGIFVDDDSSSNPQGFTWSVTYPFGTGYPGPLTWNGAPGATLTVTANGMSNTQLLMSGYPLTFNGGETLLAARGQTNHRIDLTYTGSTSGINGFVVNAAKLTLNANANANNGVGGEIFVSIPKPVSTSPQQVLMTADGPANVSGNGGTVLFFPQGDVTLGGNANQFHISAQSGTMGGNGGNATVSNKPFTTELASSTAVQVTARGANGDGGLIDLRSYFINFNGTGLKLAADAAGTGKGGQLLLDVTGPITVGSGAGAVKLSAEADAVQGSDGGRISVTTGSPADITSGQLSVKSGPTGSGGRIELLIGSTLSLTGSLKADAGLQGNGSGGLVSVSTDGELVLNGNQSGGGQALSADGAGSGPGGLVSLSIQGASQPTTIAANQQGALSLSANGGKDAMGTFLGAGGTIQLTDLNEGFVIAGAALSVKSGSGQNGGSILVDAGATLAVSGDIRAVGTGNGSNGGTIRLTAQSVNPVVFSGTSTTNILADGGSTGTTGNAGHITISNAGTGNIEFQQKVILSATAEGTSGGTAGTVSITTGGDIIFTASGNRIKTNGNGAVGVENIHIEAAGNITSGLGAGQVEFLAKGTASGHQGGFVKLISTNGDINLDSTSIDVRSGGPSAAQGDGGTIRAEAAGSIVASGNFQANGRGTGKGGHLGLVASQTLTIDAAEFHADGGNKGAGGVLELSGSNSLLIDASKISADAGTGNGSNAAGGQISISAAGSFSDLTLNGNLSVNGVGTGSGGTLALFAGQFLDVSTSELHADGASGGSINLSYGGDQPLNVLSITATGTSQNGGTVEIQHTADNDAVIVLTGTVDTRSNGELAGLFKVLPFSEDTNNISVTVNETGSFDSIVGAVGKSVDFTSFTFVNVGIDEVESKDGDVNFCIDGSGTCSVAVAAARRPMRALQASESTLQLVKTLKVTRGLGTIRSQTCDLRPDFRATLIQSSPAIRSLLLNCNNVNFATNALIDASQTPNAVSITSIGGADLLIRLPSGSRAGIINAAAINIEPTALGAITVQSSGSESSVFALGNQSGIDSGTVFRANNALTIDSKVQIGENNVNSDGLPRSLVLRTVAAPINVPSTIYALNDVLIDNSGAVSDVTIGNIDTLLPEPGTTAVRITAGGTITQLPDASINTKLVVLKSTFELIGSSDTPIRIGATDLEIEALGSGGGSAYVEQVDAIQITLGVCQATANLRIKAKGNIIINKNLHTTFGDVQILATNGVITTNPNPTFGPVITAGGGVQLAIGAFPTPPVPGTPAANVTVIPGTGGGQVYWGSTPGISATGFNTVQANNAHDIVFEVNGVTDGIVLRGGVSITTGQ